MRDNKKEMNELPEVLEYVKQSRTFIRQMQLFKEVKISNENRDKVVRTTKMLIKEAEECINKLERGSKK